VDGMTLLFSPVSLNPSSFLIWKPQNDVRSRPQVGIRQQLDISPKVHKTEIRNGTAVMSWLKRMLKTYNTVILDLLTSAKNRNPSYPTMMLKTMKMKDIQPKLCAISYDLNENKILPNISLKVPFRSGS